MTGEELAEQGMNAARNNADNQIDNWSDIAFKYLFQYAKTHEYFTTEQVRRDSEGIVPEPPDNRAWGAIIRQAKSALIIEFEQYTHRKQPIAHKAIVSLWRSRIFI